MGCKHPGFVVGVEREAALIPSPYPVFCSGADAKRAEAVAIKLLDHGCDLLVSFGLAGGLDPTLAAGTLLVPSEIVAPDGQRFACDASHHFLNAICLPMAGSDVLLASPDEKAQIRSRTGAVAVDMESHAVARVAKAKGVPFLVLRAVADTADMALPGFIADATTPEGKTRIGIILMGLARNPAALPDLIRLARTSGKAFAALKAALPVLLTK